VKLITRNTDYAVRALCCIAEQKQEVISADQLVKSLKMPRPFLPGKITLTDVMEIFQGPIRLNECKFRKSDCPYINDCFLKKKIDEIEKEVIVKLKAITIASITKKEVKVDD